MFLFHIYAVHLPYPSIFDVHSFFSLRAIFMLHEIFVSIFSLNLRCVLLDFFFFSVAMVEFDDPFFTNETTIWVVRGLKWIKRDCVCVREKKRRDRTRITAIRQNSVNGIVFTVRWIHLLCRLLGHMYSRHVFDNDCIYIWFYYNHNQGYIFALMYKTGETYT